MRPRCVPGAAVGEAAAEGVSPDAELSRTVQEVAQLKRNFLTFFAESVLGNFAKEVLELFRWTSGSSQSESLP